MVMTQSQLIITVAMLMLGTVITRFLPFAVFSENKETPKFVAYLGKFLPSAVFGMLIVYCLKDVSILQGSHGLPELIAILLTAGVHLWKRQMLVSIAVGTIGYMLLIHFVF